MKKQFFYAAAAVALLASCSNDVESGFSGVDNPEGRDVIKVGVNAVPQKQTRGTGTVGGVSILDEDGKETNNVWHGQDIYVMMFDQNTLKYATNEEKDDQAVIHNVPIYTNELFKAPGDDADQQRNFFVSDAVQSGLADAADHAIKYYPQAGNFDFWGYRVDDAAVDAQGAPVATPVLTGEEVNAETGIPAYYTVNFKIDGSQDLMAAKAEPTTDDITKLGGEDNKYRAYSAFAARRDVQPNLKFKHLLSRFEFGVLAGNAGAIGAVANVAKPAGDPINTDEVAEPDQALANAPKPDEPGVEPIVPPNPGEAPAIVMEPEGDVVTDDPGEGDEAGHNKFLEWEAYRNYLADKAAYDEAKAAYDEAKAAHDAWIPKKEALDAWNAEQNWLKWKAYNASLSPNAEYAVKIDKITLVSKTTGKMLVAKYPDDSLTAATIDIPTDLTWSEEVASTVDEDQNPVAGVAAGAPDALELKQRAIKVDEHGDPVLTDGKPTIYYNKPMVALQPYALNNLDKYDQIGEALLVAPGETLYEGILYYSQKVPVVHDHAGQTVTDDTKEWRYPFKIYASQIQKEATHQSSDTNAGLTEFKPGQTYYVYIKMYGAEKIDIITTLTPWEVGGHIDLDPEDETNQQEPTPTPEP